MTDSTVGSLILDLLWWLTIADRDYEEVMDAWHTNCPKLPIWEDANDRRLVRREFIHGRCLVRVTSAGMVLLSEHGHTVCGGR